MCSCAWAIPGKPAGVSLPAREIILLDGGHRRQRIAHDHHAQSVIERGPEYGLVSIVRRQTGQQGYSK